MINLNETEKKVLSFLTNEYSEEFGYFAFAPIMEETKLDRRIVRLACRSLKRKGLAAFYAGLWDDEGPRGSGYAATITGSQYAKEHLGIDTNEALP